MALLPAGNATFADVVVVWARNLSTKQINAFVVKKGTPGFKTSKVCVGAASGYTASSAPFLSWLWLQIENKISLRCVQNADIQVSGFWLDVISSSQTEPPALLQMTDVFVPSSARLTGVNSFQVIADEDSPPLPQQRSQAVAVQDTNKVLAISRIMVAWQPVGLALGVYDMCVRYLGERRQFGVPLSSFQACLLHACLACLDS